MQYIHCTVTEQRNPLNETMKIKVIVSSYKKAQVFKKDYVRFDNGFLKFDKVSGNHSTCVLELDNGETFDARGSIYQMGATRWTAANGQSWAKFVNRDGQLVAMNFDGKDIPLPAWVRFQLVEAAADNNFEFAE